MKLTSQKLKDAFNAKSLEEVAKTLGCSRQALYDWINAGKISDSPSHGPNYGRNWHDIIKRLGVNPDTLKPL